MVAVVHSSKGTARGIGYNSKTKIAGKTGTSQVFSIGQDEELAEEDIPDHLKDHALFVAFAPPKNPKIANKFLITTDKKTKISAKVIAIAGGLGNFEPRKPKLENLEKYEFDMVIDL